MEKMFSSARFPQCRALSAVSLAGSFFFADHELTPAHPSAHQPASNRHFDLNKK
jgi:hypothetical protein